MLKKFFGLALLACLTACVSPPSDLDLSLDRPTEHATYLVAVHALVEPVAVNKMHAWEITVRTAAGEAVPGAHIRVAGGMPQHGHGFPTQPRVTRDLGNGRYLLEGMKFSMPGWWQIKLTVDAAGGTDNVTFNTIVETRHPAPAALAAARPAAAGGVRS